MNSLKNLNVLVTGGSHGIGAAIVEVLAREGANILFTYHSDNAAAEDVYQRVVSKSNYIEMQQTDLASYEHIRKLVEIAIQKLKRIDILINNAGTLSRHSSFLDIDENSFDYVLDVNLKAPFFITQHIAKHMIENKINGSILNISSMSAEIISPGLTHYECSKAALNHLTKASANALAKHGIRVNAITPGLIATNINLKQRTNEPDVWQQRCHKIPLNRAGTPDDIAELALFIVSPSNNWMTGSIIKIDGGQGILYT